MRTAAVVAMAAALALACGSGGGGSSSGSPGGGGGGGSGGGGGGGGGPPASDWPQFRRDVRGSAFTPAPFAAADAARLALRATLDVHHAVYGQVVAAGTTGYVVTADHGALTAFDLATGAVAWTVDLDAPTRAGCDGRDRTPGIWGAAAVVDGVVYTASPDGNLRALDAASGKERWRAHVADPAPHGELVESPIVVSSVTGKAYAGIGATAPCDEIAGRLAAVDLATGAVVARPMVGPGQRGGAIWSAVAVDEDAGLVYAGTGNAVGDLAAEPLAQAVVALDARTLEPRDHWQNPTALAAADFAGAPLLFETGGRKLLAAASKDGVLYAFDRTRLADGPVWTRRLAVLDPAAPDQAGDPLAGFGSMVAPAFANGLVYAGGGRTPEGDPGAIYALDPATGEVRFRHPTPGAVLQPVVAAGDVLLAVSTQPGGGSTLEVLDARTGDRLARFDAAVWSLAPATFAAGAVIWPDASGAVRIYAPR